MDRSKQPPTKGSYRHNDVDEKLNNEKQDKMLDLYPDPRDYQGAPQGPQSYYHMVYPDTYHSESYRDYRHYNQPVYPSEYYSGYHTSHPPSSLPYNDPPYDGPPPHGPPHSYSSQYASDYSNPYYPDTMSDYASYRQPAYPTKYHPSPPRPHLSQSEPRYYQQKDGDHVEEKLALPERVRPFQTYMLWSIFNFLFCWGILGAIGMVNSFEARQKHRQGDDKAAAKHKRCALGINIAATITGIIATIVTVVLLVNYYQHDDESASSSMMH